MSYPLTFTPFDWSDLPEESTAFDKEHAQEAEKRLAEFVEKYEVHWRFPVKRESELPKVAVAKGDIFLVEETKELVLYNGSEYVNLNSFVPYWRPPVTKSLELPVGGNIVGNVRLVTETKQFYICIATTGTFEEQWHIYEVASHHWLAPVTKEFELPTSSNVVGDVRLVTETNQFFICIKTTGTISEQWKEFSVTPHHWLSPVAKVAELPVVGNIDGDARVVLETHVLYIWNATKSEWKALEGGGGPSTITKRVTAPISGSGTKLTGTVEKGTFLQRLPICLPVTTKRWRLRIRNYSTTGETEGAKTITLTGVWKGVPKWTSTRWKGAFTSAPTKVIAPSTIPIVSDLTTEWVESSEQQFTANVISALSFGLEGANSKLSEFVYSEFGGLYWSGSGSAAAAGEAAEPSLEFGPEPFDLFDIRLEYEYVTPTETPVLYGIAIGDSVTLGESGGDGGCFMYESWPGAAALRTGQPIVNMGVGGSETGGWITPSNWKWKRIDLVTTVPDFAIVSLGTNDIAASVSVSTIKANLVTIIEYLKSTLEISRVYLGTIAPREFTGGEETARVEVNTWIRALNAGIDGVIEFDKGLSLQATPSKGDSAWFTSYPHPLRGGYQRMGSSV